MVKHQWATGPACSALALIGPLGDGVGDAATAEQPPARWVAVAAIGNEMLGALAGSTSSGGPGDADGVQDGCKLGAVVALAWGEDHAQGPAAAVAGQVNFGGQPTPGPAERLDLVMRDPLFPSAAASARAGRLRAPAAC